MKVRNRVARVVEMKRLFIVSMALVDLVYGCGELDDSPEPLIIDPAFFTNQRFDCSNVTAAPACPPATCVVDDAGQVTCDSQCNPDGDHKDCTVFSGPEGRDLCVPKTCTVDSENAAPDCPNECATTEGDVTCYSFNYSCN